MILNCLECNKGQLNLQIYKHNETLSFFWKLIVDKGNQKIIMRIETTETFLSPTRKQ